MNDFGRGMGPAAPRRVHLVKRWLTGRAHRGYCPVCERPTFFLVEKRSAKDGSQCWTCGSWARSRALLQVLHESFPHWRDLSVHEWSPGGPASDKLFRECPRYLPTHYSSSIQRGEVVGGLRCEDLGAQTFPANRFDLVITSGVFDRATLPRDSFTEIARTLKPNGAHIFTLGAEPNQPSLGQNDAQIGDVGLPARTGAPRERASVSGKRDWAHELPPLVHAWSGVFTTVYRICDRRLGIDGRQGEVFVSRKISSAPRRE